jgi:hypothetical protein
MITEEIIKRVPYVAFPGTLALIDRMGGEGIPTKIDRAYLAGMADGTQFQYRQAFRYLGLTSHEDRPTALLTELVRANPTDRRELLGKIMSERYPELTGLPLDASKDDFFAVLEEQYGVTSDVQRRKMLTFFVASADYAEFPISPDIRPTKARTGPRKPRGKRRTSAPTGRRTKAASRTPATSTDQGGQGANVMATQQHDISLGNAGSVSVVVSVDRWWELSENQLIQLRNLIKATEALRDSGS